MTDTLDSERARFLREKLHDGVSEFITYVIGLENEILHRVPIQDLPPRPDQCPYPLHQTYWGGASHERYVGTLQNEKDGEDGLHVIECEACHNVTFQRPVAMAGGQGVPESVPGSIAVTTTAKENRLNIRIIK